MNYRIIVFLLCTFPNIVYAMRRIDVVPRGSHNKAKKSYCAWFTCCKTRAQKDAQERALDIERLNREHKVAKEEIERKNAERVKRLTLSARSGDMRDLGHTEEYIQTVRVAQNAYRAEDAAQQTLSIARAVTPLGGLLSLPSSEQVTARPSVSATQPQLPSPTP